MDELTATMTLHGNSDHIFCCTFPSCEIVFYSLFEVQDLTTPLLETGTLCVMEIRDLRPAVSMQILQLKASSNKVPNRRQLAKQGKRKQKEENLKISLSDWLN